MRLILALWGCGLVMGLADGQVSESDLEKLCAVASELEGTGVAPGKRLVQIGERLESDHADALVQAWRVIQAAPPKLRTKAYRELLASSGHAGFQCAPLERALSRP